MAGLLLAAACGGSGAPGQQQGAGGRGGGAPAMPVEITTLAPKPVEQTGDFVGTVRSRRSTTITPQVEGMLTSIPAKSGDKVQPGTLLMTIDAQPEQAALASLQSLRAARESDAQFARQQADRAKALLDAGAGSKQEYDQAQAQQKAAEAQLRALEEQIRQQQAQLAFYRIVAPTNGTVGDIPVRVGDRVSRTTKLTTVEDNSGLEIYVSVPVQQASNLRLGLPLRIVTETGKVIVALKVDFVSPSVDDQTQTVLVKATLTDRALFRNEQFVRIQIVWTTAPALTVPIVAVQRINGQFFAFVAEPDDKGTLIAHQRPITLGPIFGNDYIVTGGLKEGEKLITGGLQKIGDGAPVQELPSRGAGGAGPEGRGK